jgi:hypothetical protein
LDPAELAINQGLHSPVIDEHQDGHKIAIAAAGSASFHREGVGRGRLTGTLKEPGPPDLDILVLEDSRVGEAGLEIPRRSWLRARPFPVPLNKIATQNIDSRRGKIVRHLLQTV